MLSGMSSDSSPDSANSVNSARNHALDAARGILMMLGVLLHAANIYSTSGGWLVEDSQRSESLDALSNAIHVFRMPAFFWISGYFCALTFARSGAAGLLRKRLPRLFVPLLSTWITLNVAQKLFVASFSGQSLGEALRGGVPLYHLWFLVDLMLYMVLAALALPQLHRLGALVRRLENAPLAPMLSALALLSVAAGLAARASGIAYVSWFGLTDLFRLASYAPFFAVGILMHGHARWRQRFLCAPPWLIVVALPLAIYAEAYTRGQGFLINEMAGFVKALTVWFSVAVVLRFFHDFVREGSRLTGFLSDSAYSVYLFHHLIVVVLGSLLLAYSIGAWPKFLIVATVSLLLSILIHVRMIRRSRVARLLFNGK